MDHLFIITYGRSGSTALTNVLNAGDGVCIRGENGGAFLPLSRSVGRILWARQEYGRWSELVHSPWHGIGAVDADEYACGLCAAFSKSVLRPPADTRIVGFKEIRYTRRDCSDGEFAFLVDLMLRCFTGARMIFLTRDAGQVARSGWWADEPETDVRALIANADERFHAAATRHPDSTFMIDHADFDGRPEGLRPLLDWVGISMDHAKLANVANSRLMHLK